jgi:long-chain acyl-CoA synthetase
MERKGSLRKSLNWSFHLLQQGYNLLIFPEGTRSRSGKMARFQRGVGHLALRSKVGVLPMYLSTYDALPPGSWYLKATDVAATVGPFLPYETLKEMGEGFSTSEAERMVIALIQRIVEGLRDEEKINVEDYIKDIQEQYAAEKPSRPAEPVKT